MTENEKSKIDGLRLWLILAAIITAIVSAVGILFSKLVFSMVGSIYGIVFLISVLGNPYLSILAWKHFRVGNRQLAAFFSIIISIVSLINAGISFFSILNSIPF